MNTILTLAIFSILASADPSRPITVKAKNSKCSIKSSGGEYPTFKVLRGKEIIYTPSSDGIVNALISLDGKYVALGAGETELIEDFGVMVINCATGQRKGFLPNKATFLKQWTKDKLIVDGAEISAESFP